MIFAGCAKTSYPTDTEHLHNQKVVTAANGQSFTLETLDRLLTEQKNLLGIPGLAFALIENGQIKYVTTKGVANINTNELLTNKSVFEVASLSKPVFAYLVLKLVDEGVISLDTPLYKYRLFEELESDSRYHEVTARSVLSHTTGFPNWRWFDPAPESMNIKRGTMYMKRDPGEFGYSGEGYNYLAEVIGDLNGLDLLTLDQLYQQKIAEPLGLVCSSFVRSSCVAINKVSGHKGGKVSDEQWPRSFPDDTPQTFGAAGRLHTTAKDYARIMVAIMNNDGLTRDSANEFFSNQSVVPVDTTTHKINGVTHWGLGIAIEPTPFGNRYEHGGNNGDFTSSMMLYREKKIGYVLLTNSENAQTLNAKIEKLITEGF